jgi:hypothetical protein
MLLATFGFGYASPLDACASDIGSATGDVGKAGVTIAKAAGDCTHGSPNCAHDIANAAGYIADAATQISNAVNDCGSVGNECAEALSVVFQDLNSMAQTADSAADDCVNHLADPFPCIEDVASITGDVVSVTRDLKQATKTCKNPPPAEWHSPFEGLEEALAKDATITVTDNCATSGDCLVTVSKIDCPTDEPQPLNFQFSGSGTALEAISTANVHVTAKALGIKVLDKTMSACGTATIDLPAGAGTITLNLLDCPVADKAVQKISGSVAAKAALPAGKLNIDIVATDDDGKRLIDLGVVVAPKKGGEVE